ncbi:MAG TPA: hypothetical protein VLJ41_15140, partial [Segetibacter sp.]|nr:hypothetical protein [Segetibacter sp.]
NGRRERIFKESEQGRLLIEEELFLNFWYLTQRLSIAELVLYYVSEYVETKVFNYPTLDFFESSTN